MGQPRPVSGLVNHSLRKSAFHLSSLTQFSWRIPLSFSLPHLTPSRRSIPEPTSKIPIFVIVVVVVVVVVVVGGGGGGGGGNGGVVVIFCLNC